MERNLPNDLYYDIVEMVEQDRNPITIAEILEIPVSWVYEVSEEIV
jgi:hypothetical protein